MFLCPLLCIVVHCLHKLGAVIWHRIFALYSNGVAFKFPPGNPMDLMEHHLCVRESCNYSCCLNPRTPTILNINLASSHQYNIRLMDCSSICCKIALHLEIIIVRAKESMMRLVPSCAILTFILHKPSLAFSM